MKDAIAAIQALLNPLGWDVRYGDATGATYPYVLLWSSPGQPGSEPSAAGGDGFEDLLGVTMVDTMPANVLVIASRVRALLDGARLSAGGHYLTLRLRFSEPVKADREVTLPDTNTHPSFAVDHYHLAAQPLS